MESWQFIESPAGGWYWLCSDVISRKTRTSAATFKTRMECIADAMGYGYQSGLPAVRTEQPAPRGSAGAPRARPPSGARPPARAEAKPGNRSRSARRTRRKQG